ncbi:hypothetical protein N7G274_007132 [Stereocaulon virgatum]|uniref:Uncharacterized protein n=1 Tax=Stereocaulon virgatum TaxID=373712 RepID=A0ABR4A2S0_9LECA
MAPASNKNRIGKPSAKPEVQKRKRQDPGPGSAMLSRIIDEMARKHKQQEAGSEIKSGEYSVDTANWVALTITHGAINDCRLSSQSSIDGGMLAQSQVNPASPLDKDVVNGTAACPQSCADQYNLPTENPGKDFKNAPSDPEQLGAWIGQTINDVETDPRAEKVETNDSSKSHRSPRTYKTQMGDGGQDVLKKGREEKSHQTRVSPCKQEDNLNKESLCQTPMPDNVMAIQKSGAALDNNKGSQSFTQALHALTSSCTEAWNQSSDRIDSFTCGNKLSPKASGSAHPDSSDSITSRELIDLASWGRTSPPTSQDPEIPKTSTGHNHKTTSLSNRHCGDLTMGIGSSRHADLADPYGAETAALFLGPPQELPTPTTSQPQGIFPPATSQLRRLAPAPTGPSASNLGGGDSLRFSDRSTEHIIAAYERIPKTILEINGRYFGPLQGEPQAHISPIDGSIIQPLDPDLPLPTAQPNDMTAVSPPTSDMLRPANPSGSVEKGIILPPMSEMVSPAAQSRSNTTRHLSMISNREGSTRQSRHISASTAQEYPVNDLNVESADALPGSNNTTTQEWTGLLQEDDPRVDVDLTRNINHIIRASMASQDQSRGLPRGTSLAWCTGSMDGRRHFQELQSLMIVIGPHSPPFIPRTREVGKAMMKLVHILNGEGDSPFAAIMRPPPYIPRTATRWYQGGQHSNSTFGSPTGPVTPFLYTHGVTTQIDQGRHPSNAFVGSQVGPSAPSPYAHMPATQTYRGCQPSHSALSSQHRLSAPLPCVHGSTTQMFHSGERSNAALRSQAQPSAQRYAGLKRPFPYEHSNTTQTHEGGQSSNSTFGSPAGASAQRDDELSAKKQRRGPRVGTFISRS